MPSPPQVPALANMNVDDYPPSANNDVEMAGKPADARGKRRRGPEVATVDGGSVGVGRPDQRVKRPTLRKIALVLAAVSSRPSYMTVAHLDP
jgi:hypothetical protein